MTEQATENNPEGEPCPAQETSAGPVSSPISAAVPVIAPAAYEVSKATCLEAVFSPLSGLLACISAVTH